MDENPDSQDPILITFGTDHLVQKKSADGVDRWYDEWTEIFESPTDDADIIACKTQGPYEGRTVMAVLRDIRMINYPHSGRWIVHICKSALVEQSYQSGVPQVTINILEPTRNLIAFAPNMYQTLNAQPWREFYIDSFRWFEFTLLNALLNIRQVEDGVDTSSDTSTGILNTWSWVECLAHQTETIGERSMTLLFTVFFGPKLTIVLRSRLPNTVCSGGYIFLRGYSSTEGR